MRGILEKHFSLRKIKIVVRRKYWKYTPMMLASTGHQNRFGPRPTQHRAQSSCWTLDPAHMCMGGTIWRKHFYSQPASTWLVSPPGDNAHIWSCSPASSWLDHKGDKGVTPKATWTTQCQRGNKKGPHLSPNSLLSSSSHKQHHQHCGPPDLDLIN